LTHAGSASIPNHAPGELRAKSRFAAPQSPPVAPERATRHTTTGNAAPPSYAKTRRAPEIAKKFANTCQHFLCQNAVFMRHDGFFQNSFSAFIYCGFRCGLWRLSKMPKQVSNPFARSIFLLGFCGV